MAKLPPRDRKHWTSGEVGRLRQLAVSNTPTGLIAHQLGRSKDAVRSKASAKNISLKPTNRSPYGPRRKR